MTYVPPSQEDLLQLAIAVAKVAHSGQRRRGGEDYFNHLARVAEKARESRGTRAAIVGYLHDTIEDTTVTQSALRAIGFPRDIVDDVLVLSSMVDERYEHFIDRVLRFGSDDALAVKIADIEDNIPGANPVKLPLYIQAQDDLTEELDRRNAAQQEASNHRTEEVLVG